MFRFAITLCLLPVASLQAATAPPSPGQRVVIPTEKARQFDFWVGQWDVRNRHLKPDGNWRPGGLAKARIDSVLGGRALLEQWAGQGPLKLRGFSLRTYDAQQKRWELVLNWHSGRPSSFSYMVGNFAGQRGEFFPPGPNQRTRFTFSKAATKSCQWDQAVSKDGMNWQTNWVMSFTRTGPAHSLSADNLPIRTPPRQTAGQFVATRELDGLIGIWQGKAQRLQADGTWQKGMAVRRVSSMLDGFGLIQLTRFSWGEESIAAISFNRQQGKWFEVGMSTLEPDCHWMSGVTVGRQLRLNELPTSNNGFHHVWNSLKQDAFTWTRESRPTGQAGKGKVVVKVDFQRSRPTGRTVAPANGKPSLAAQLARAQALLGSGKAAAAEKLLSQLASANPKSPRPQFMLGYSLHLQKKYAAAVSAYKRAASFPQTRALAEYNMACICSLQNKKDQAFQHLNAALKTGFKNRAQLAGDPDFANIRSDPRFRKLAPQPVPDNKLFVEPTRIIHKFVGQSAGDQFGWTARRAGDWDKDGVVDFVTTAPTHAGAGKVYVYSSKTGKLLFQKRGQRGELFGNSAVGAGDVNNDGVPDLIVGAPNTAAAGNAYVFSGKDGKVLHHFKGRAAGDKFGYEVSEMGDLDGDQHADILVGATKANGTQAGCGKVFVYSGKTGKLMFELSGQRRGDSFGNAAACSADGHGGHLLAIGAQNAGPKRGGQVYVYRVSGSTAKPAFTLRGSPSSVNFGQMFISFPGDVNGDRVPDIYASDFSDSTGARGGGRVLISSGKDGTPLLNILGKRAGEGLGTSPSDAGDVNGDGVGDLVIGAWQHNSAAASGGKVYLRDGKTGALLRAWTCRQAGDTFGFDACGIGDVDGDGNVDFLLTSAWSNVRGPKTGRVFILAGSKSYPADKSRK